MKFNPAVSRDSGKNRKQHFNAPSHERRKIMSAPLTKELRAKHGIRSIPIRVDDEVIVMRGRHRGNTGRVIRCYRKKFVIHVDKESTVRKGTDLTVRTFEILHPSEGEGLVALTKLKLDKDRRDLVERKAAGRAKALGILKGKHTDESVA
ncbi:ribosomal protein L24 [Cooperia oncophora]